MRCLQIILGISVREKQRNTDVRAKASIETVETIIRKIRLRWPDYVARMEPHRIPRQLLVCKFEGRKRSVGSQKLRWVNVVMRELKKCNLNKDWMNIAQHCAKWRSITDAVVTELNEKAEKREKMEKDKRRKETRERKYQIRLTYSVLNLVARLQPKQGRSCQSPTETWSSNSRDPLLLSLPPKL
ncbi:uncharacterized protein LOC134194444 [Corticium candelabrum]|uniref:uncharacterized protein LOC134194444 n=1 Tax=Corticium candelabrum TaxID=121492 RepID=UPI002E26CDE6|nr:uncharacterized protein LOC134194444 [Corticium candelabrum]